MLSCNTNSPTSTGPISDQRSTRQRSCCKNSQVTTPEVATIPAHSSRGRGLGEWLYVRGSAVSLVRRHARELLYFVSEIKFVGADTCPSVSHKRSEHKRWVLCCDSSVGVSVRLLQIKKPLECRTNWNFADGRQTKSFSGREVLGTSRGRAV